MSVPASRAQAFHWRRNLLALCLAAISGSAFSTTALATDAYPSKPVTLVTSFSVGSGPDTVLRLVADRLGKAWSQRVIVENRPGGRRLHRHRCRQARGAGRLHAASAGQ